MQKQTVIVTHLEALNFYFCEFLHFLMSEIYKINKIQCRATKIARNGSFRNSTDCPILISRKI